MPTRGRMLAAAAALAVAGAVLVGGTSVAQAATKCPSDRLCLYQLEDFHGKMVAIEAGDNVYRFKKFANRTSSVMNRTPFEAYLAPDWDGHGKRYVSKPHSSDKTLTNNHIDNDVESVFWERS